MREDGAPSDRAQRLADDGKRFPAMDVAFSNCSSSIGGSLREDGAGLDRYSVEEGGGLEEGGSRSTLSRGMRIPFLCFFGVFVWFVFGKPFW